MNRTIPLFLILSVSLTMEADASLIDVEFIDNDGPQWTGTVNTQTDLLTINSWNEGAGSINWWTPVTPLTLVATDFDGNRHDVTSDWNGDLVDFGFLSDSMLSEISWLDGDIPADTSGWTTTRPGWGITSWTLRTGEEEFIQGRGNDWFGFLPQGDNPQGAARAVADHVSVSVPEPSSLALLALGMIVTFRAQKNSMLT